MKLFESLQNSLSKSVWLLVSLALSSCTQSFLGGPITMTVIQPSGAYCKYQVGPATIQTLDSVSEMRGLMGQVVSHQDDLESSSSILESGMGFQRLDLRFAGSGNTFGPLDKTSLIAASLYYSLEKGYFLFKNLDPAGDLNSIVPNLRDTFIVQNAKIKAIPEEGKMLSDNAAYLQMDGPQGPRNYFLSFPNEEIKTIPLGFNAGVMVHEFAHYFTQYAFHMKRSEAGKNLTDESENTLNAFDEGNSDYFAFLATRDPGFFHCSFPNAGDRDLSHPKVLTNQQLQAIRTSVDFDSHDGGAVWASVQYQIGEAIGHEQNGQSLISFLNRLATCTGLSSSSARVTFNTLKNCHIQALGNRATPQVQQIYQSAFGALGAN
ncbi:MAG: hypothetical protein EBQ85_08350 [Proteobacteria bacterium]|nr:hypothetical protein [Pseudomonadota bacterium]